MAGIFTVMSILVHPIPLTNDGMKVGSQPSDQGVEQDLQASRVLSLPAWE